MAKNSISPELRFIIYALVFNLALSIFSLGWNFTTIGKDRIVYVDSNKVVNGYQGMMDARKLYNQKASAWKANIDTLTNEVQKEIKQYDAQSAKMTLKERSLSEELIKTKQKQLYEYQQTLSNQAQQEDNKMTSEVMIEINAYIQKFGEENGYTIILAATEYGNLAFADDALDITDRVLEGLNKQYSAK